MVHIGGLQPYTDYSAEVFSYTAVGKGPSDKVLFSTLQDAPADAPTNVQVGKMLFLVQKSKTVQMLKHFLQ